MAQMLPMARLAMTMISALVDSASLCFATSSQSFSVPDSVREFPPSDTRARIHLNTLFNTHFFADSLFDQLICLRFVHLDSNDCCCCSCDRICGCPCREVSRSLLRHQALQKAAGAQFKTLNCNQQGQLMTQREVNQ